MGDDELILRSEKSIMASGSPLSYGVIFGGLLVSDIIRRYISSGHFQLEILDTLSATIATIRATIQYWQIGKRAQGRLLVLKFFMKQPLSALITWRKSMLNPSATFSYQKVLKNEIQVITSLIS
ncbi:MAG: hypothetical protein JWO06_4069 [Bacteroidota bacterium]|nr:hypothetical protein [Bacteroidota bacterium]